MAESYRSEPFWFIQIIGNKLETFKKLKWQTALISFAIGQSST